MPIQLNEENGGKLINVHVSGKLEKADYEYFTRSSNDSHGSTENCVYSSI